ncbi:hypothetical protein [Falsirhodobacter xinxiangensis]|uniref:hypothetical protein n=1 Tax=Falsirhodobacter xinxiangensis TaxID=2530049 RepID=UPI0010AAF373|nr:hypothetical protein [Rhodobacter xinxiangensis]
MGEIVVFGLGAALAWAGGEGGRVLVASGMGGLTRWIASDRRALRDGVLAVIGGAVAGQYLWPIVLWSLRMEETPDSIAMAAFVAGTMGISGIRIAAAVFEARAAKARDA